MTYKDAIMYRGNMIKVAADEIYLIPDRGPYVTYKGALGEEHTEWDPNFKPTDQTDAAYRRGASSVILPTTKAVLSTDREWRRSSALDGGALGGALGLLLGAIYGASTGEKGKRIKKLLSNAGIGGVLGALGGAGIGYIAGGASTYDASPMLRG